jgi:hypothetical protein
MGDRAYPPASSGANSWDEAESHSSPLQPCFPRLWAILFQKAMIPHRMSAISLLASGTGRHSEPGEAGRWRRLHGFSSTCQNGGLPTAVQLVGIFF